MFPPDWGGRVMPLSPEVAAADERCKARTAERVTSKLAQGLVTCEIFSETQLIE